MGLLDGQLDPQTMAQLQLAGGLLSPGSFGQGLQKGVAGYQDALGNAQLMQYRQQQIASAQQEQQVRELQMRRTLQQLKFGDSFLNDAGGADPSSAPQQQTLPSPSFTALAQGAQAGSVGPTNVNAARMNAQPTPTAAQPLTVQKSRLESLSQDQIAAGVVAGVIPKELVDLWTSSKFGRALPPGWKQNLDGTMTYVPDPTKGVTMTPDGKSVVQMPGAADTLGGLAEATKAGEMRGTNKNTPIPLDRLDRGGLPPGVGPNSTMDDFLRPAPSPASLPTLPGASQSLVGAILADNKQLGSPPATFAVYNQGQRVSSQPLPSVGQPAAAPFAPAGFQSAADLAGAKVAAENKANLDSKPALTSADDFARNAQASDKTYSDELNKKVEEGLNVKARNVEILSQLKDYQAGISNPEIRAKVASNLINMFPESPKIQQVAESINGGSVVSAETLNFLIAGAAVTNAIQVLDGQGKLTNGVRAQLQTAAESAGTDPGALKRIISIQNKFADRDIAEQSARAASIRAGTYHPETWQADYAQIRNNQISAPDAPTATALPKNLTASSLKVGEVYQLPNGQTGKWDGFKFKGQ